MVNTVEFYITHDHLTPKWRDGGPESSTAIYRKGLRLCANENGPLFDRVSPNLVVIDWIDFKNHLIDLPKDLADRIIEATDKASNTMSEVTKIMKEVFKIQETGVTPSVDTIVVAYSYMGDPANKIQDAYCVKDMEVAIDEYHSAYKLDAETIESKGLNGVEIFYIPKDLADRIVKAVSLCSEAKEAKERVLKEVKAGGYFELKKPTEPKTISKNTITQVTLSDKIHLCRWAVILGLFMISFMMFHPHQSESIN